MTFKSRQKSQNSDDYQVITNEQPITRVSTRVLLDDNLTWKRHLSLLAGKLSKSI